MKTDTWYGKIPDDWEVFTVEELVKNNILFSPKDGNHGNIHPKGEDFVENGIPFVMASDLMNGEVDYKNCKKITKKQAQSLQKGFAINGDILLSHKATIGRTAIVKTDLEYILLTPQVTYYRVKNPEKLSQLYLYCLFNSPRYQETLKMLAGGGSTRDYIGITAQGKIPILLPPKEEQNFIEEIYWCLDRKLENLRRQNETLERIVQTLFKHWFVDFEFPNEHGNPYKSSGGAMERSELGEIPEGWGVGRLGDLFTLNYGKALTLENRVSGQYPVVGSSGILGSHKSYLVTAPGIVIGRKGTIGQVIWLEKNFYPIDTTFYVEDILRCNGLHFYYFLLKRQNFQRITSDSAVPGLNRDMAYSLETVIPKIPYINEFNTITKAVFNKLNLNNEQITTLTKTRDVLLPKLMSGQIRVGG